MFVRCHNWVWTCRRTEATAFALSPNTWPMSNELRPSNLYSSNAASSRGESLESAAGSLFRGTVDFSCSLCPGLVLFDEFECLTEKRDGRVLPVMRWPAICIQKYALKHVLGLRKIRE